MQPMRQGPLTTISANHALATDRCTIQNPRPTIGLEFVVRASAIGQAPVCPLVFHACVRRRALNSCNAVIEQDLVGNGTGIVRDISKFDLGVCGGSARRSVTERRARVRASLPLGRLSMP
jgi:hypothetical protein